ncbi:MotB family protein [Mesorhizobium sp. M2A.F.Ca.ET.037.01.1.1]|uniref:MotB family protein n=4 Tax=Mesorhizobium TaxID=68287 RepID=UPI000F75BF97|nr:MULTISPECIES: MotB family protein [unclassified Mesorhizobium]RVC67817.1 MotB family protein [Mesorhizobium sp. M00.F.Ca.ET.038.03.1.1]RVC70483.1 MotB family protein [Mesorhizobium sp. M2A.F.Ca.ET.046.02.1.1]AZO37052.1 MotB family protein [Mesorhizobium sp. M2A.F.Ca.ET.046.03.2.1]RUX06580.1 MotB family protein [Mesorhizobium sp. M2A.F.Ca.ET.037.01.1.1]RWA92087.1 MAG: MotB family protein [Mesorhizobium sp.]
MSAIDHAEPRHEIIIVKRNHDGHDDDHHGGVWKIAFADFMTAMMCFFLVMWLINAANEQTKAAVASYFNPVELIDRNSSRKGLEDLGDGPSKVGLTADNPQQGATKAGEDGKGGAGSSERRQTKDGAQDAQLSDEKLFADPYAVLAEIAADTGVLQNVSAKGEGGAQTAGPATGASGGESYRDPFAPDFWSQQVAAPGAEATAERAKIDGDPAKPGEKVATVAVPKAKAAPAAPPMTAAPLEPLATSEKTEAKSGQKAAQGEAEKPSGEGNKTDKAQGGKLEADKREAAAGDTKAEAAKAEKAEQEQGADKGDKAPSKAALQQAADIKKELAKAFLPGEKLADGVSVEATDKGVVISITDQLDFGMFEIGSAMPRRELVLAMEKIGHIINEKKGTITISGHTDARPFRSDTYDNWRLSTARAHAAYYMLVRGGVDESRITEVSGFADRQPKIASDPMAATNRRIEILMTAGG